MNLEKTLQLEKEARDINCQNVCLKNIGLHLRQKRIWSGRGDISEIRTLEKAVPLTSDELFAIMDNRTLKAVTKLDDNGIIYAESFSMNTDSVDPNLAQID